jgi:Family of unknown function (DUF6114)
LSLQSVRTIAFILSLLGGIIIVLGSIIALLLAAFGSPYGIYYGMGPGMMGGYWFGYGSSWLWVLTFVSLICGVIVLIGALMFNARPVEHMTWGILVLAFSIVSFIGMGGYFIGAVLGIAGGALALSYRTTHKT